MSIVKVNDTVRTTVTFRSFSTDTEQGSPEQPATVDVTLVNNDDDTETTLTPVNTSDGVFYADWTPTAEGNYTLTFLGTFDDASEDQITQEFEVIGEDESEEETTSLLEDFVITFTAGLSPLYIAPEELSSIFEDAPLTTISEEIFIASSEAKKILDLDDDITEEDMPLVVYDYVRAAAACKLSKIYESTDNGDISNFRLGDLQVITQPVNKSKINRGNASNWCELAYALRNEMINNSVGMKAVVKGSAYRNPIPVRALRRV